MNAILVKKALETVLNPNLLVNMVSQRVRQLNSGGGGRCRPLLADTANLGAVDIALREIIEDKMSFEMPENLGLTRPTGKEPPAASALGEELAKESEHVCDVLKE